MAHKIRVILNVEEDVIRDIAIDAGETLEDLHNAITNAFGFDGSEMASFYRSDEEWQQGEEHPLFDMSDGTSGTIAMSNVSIDNVLYEPHDKLIYVYDFFNMWTFYVELIETEIDLDFELPSLLFSLGNIPKTAPDVFFEGEGTVDNSDSQFTDGFEDYDVDDDLENYDSY